MEGLLLFVHVLAAAGVIGLVLLQHGKGADVGASFGSGSAGSVFGAAGSANFLSRSTAAFATVFFATSLALTYISSHKGGGKVDVLQQGVMKDYVPPAGAKPDVPAVPGKSDAPAPVEQKAKDIPN